MWTTVTSGWARRPAPTAGAGVDFTQRVRTSVTYFNSQYEDQVAFFSTRFGVDEQPDFINVAGSEASGWELDAALQRPVGGLTAAATYKLHGHRGHGPLEHRHAVSGRTAAAAAAEARWHGFEWGTRRSRHA